MSVADIIHRRNSCMYLLQRFVVDKDCRIFGEIKLSTLDLLSEFPALVSRCWTRGRRSCINDIQRREANTGGRERTC